MNKTYTGVGTRNTNPEIAEIIVKIGKFLARKGYILRSGGTATAIRLAEKNNIPVFNLGERDGLDKFREFCKTL